MIAVSHAAALQLPSLRPRVVHAGVESSTEINPNSGAPERRSSLVRLVACGPTQGAHRFDSGGHRCTWSFLALRLEIAGTGPQRDDLEREVNRLSIPWPSPLFGFRTSGPYCELGTSLRCPHLMRACPFRLLRRWRKACRSLPLPSVACRSLSKMARPVTLSLPLTLRRSPNACGSSCWTRYKGSKWAPQVDNAFANTFQSIAWLRRSKPLRGSLMPKLPERGGEIKLPEGTRLEVAITAPMPYRPQC